jgi:L-histidine Nalpha-methyltransferase
MPRRTLPDAALVDEVRQGLARTPLELPPRLFYDERGSRLFERITTLPEYYLTRTERRLLENVVRRWVAELAPRTLLELGAGNAEKTRIILDAMVSAGRAHLYVPVDVSADFLDRTAQRLRAEYAGFSIRPLVADMTGPLPRLDELERPMLIAFLGSTIGNLTDEGACALLTGLRGQMRGDDRLLLGADLVKERHVLEAAYNDRAGVTAEFNRNILRVMNRMFDADFDPDAFQHQAYYNAAGGRIEMLLVSARQQTVNVPGIARIELRPGEPIRTEISNKYTRQRLENILDCAHLQAERWGLDDEDRYAVLLAAPTSDRDLTPSPRTPT